MQYVITSSIMLGELRLFLVALRKAAPVVRLTVCAFLSPPSAFISHLNVPNVVMVPIADAGATWDLFVVWQRGKIASPLRTLLSELNLKFQ